METSSSTPLRLNLSADLTIAQRGKRWVQYDQTSRLGSLPGMPAPMPEQSKLVAGTHQFGGLWIPPNALRDLKVGQILDRDRITSEDITVRELLSDGVVLAAISRAARSDVIYDVSSGYLVRGYATQSSEVDRQSAELRLTRSPN